jgi:enamine deaminase RidA (YjgF/YER057c/UK114 family)
MSVNQSEWSSAVIERFIPTPTSHRVVRHNDTLYVGGVGALNREEGIGGQTRQVCQRIEGFLGEAGSNKGSLLSATIYIADSSMKAEMNDVWNEWLAEVGKPTRATIVVGDMGDRILIEVVVVASID